MVLVLLHGHPRTHTTWHRVAPLLSGSFFVVCPDLGGYGQSTLLPDAPGHVDRAHEEADRAAGRKVRCPTLLLVSTDDDLDIHGNPEAIWRPWAAGELRSRPIHSGHH